MPKKFIGKNTKSLSADARKAATRAADEERKKAEEEDEYWKDDDKHVNRKLQRKENKERKKQELVERKLEKIQLEEEETKSLKEGPKLAPSKISRSQIQDLVRDDEKQGESKKKELTHLQEPLEENINRITVDGEEARTVEEAISVLTLTHDEDDKHPERRLKAALTVFEERRLPELKAENPQMRMSQLKQLLKKEWMRAPENPVNQLLK